MKWVSLLLVGLMCLSVVVSAGELITNDTGEYATGLRVAFSTPVLITAFGDILTNVDQEGLSYEFVFSGGTVQPWGDHWLNWAPATAQIISYEWLTEAAFADSSTVTDSPGTLCRAVVPPAKRGQLVVVSTLADEINGSLACVSSLLASPGSDGVSLREAILATNNAPGSHTIRFHESLRGGRILIGSTGLGYLPRIRGGNLLIDGDADRDGIPDVTLDGSESTEKRFDPETGYHSIAALFVTSSDVIIYGMALENFNVGVEITGCLDGCAATHIRNVQVVDNGILVPPGNAKFGIMITSRPAPLRGGGVAIEEVAIYGNRILCHGEMGIYVLGGSGGQFENEISSLLIARNTITGGKTGITVFAGDTASDYMVPEHRPIVYSDENVISDVQICSNTIADSTDSGIHVAAGNFGNQGNKVTDVSVVGNKIESSSGPRWCGIDVVAATQAGERTTRDNHIEEVDILNNAITGFRGGVSVKAGRDRDLTGNTVSSVAVVGNRIVGFSEYGITLGGGERGASDGTLSTAYLACNELTGWQTSSRECTGIEVLGGGWGQRSKGNTVSNIHISNNTIRSVNTAISLFGGRDGANGNFVGPIDLFNNATSNCYQVLQQEPNLYGGFSNTLSVSSSNSTIQDRTPPELVSLRVEVLSGNGAEDHEQVQLAVKARDTQTGIGSCVVHLANHSDPESSETVILSLESGTPRNGTFFGSLSLESSHQETTWEIVAVELGDNACPEANAVQLDSDVLRQRGFPAEFSVGPVDRLEEPVEFASIAYGLQAAIDAAAPGQTLRIPPGTYMENLTIDKGITLIGSEGDEVWIVGVEEERPVITIEGESGKTITVAIEHLGIGKGRGRNGNGIEAHGNVELHLTNVELLDNEAHGIEVGGTVRLFLENCEARSMGSGIEFYGSTSGVIRNCSITGNGAAGIWIHGSAEVEVLDSRIAQNGYVDQGDGIYVHENATLKLTRSEVVDNCRCGVRAESSSNVISYVDNTVSGNGKADYCGFTPI